MAFFQPRGSIEKQVHELLYDSPHYKTSYTGLNGLKNSDVLTAVTIIAGDIARFPIIKKDIDGNIVQDERLNYLMNIKSAGKVSARHWKFAMAVNAILCGNSYSRIIRDPVTGNPLEYEFYPPSAVAIETKNNGKDYQYLLYPLNGDKQIRCEPEDVIHWKFFTTDTLYGRSPLLSLSDEINLQESGIATLMKFFSDGFSSGILSMKGAQLSGEARRKARQEFEKSREGSKGGSPVVIDSTMDYTPLEIDTNVLQLINSNNYSTAQIAKCLRVPAYKLAVTNPNQSVKQLNDDYILNDLPYYFDAITSEHQLKQFTDEERHNYVLSFDTRSVTGLSIEDVKKMVDDGLITRNEGRVSLGKKKIDDPNMDRIQVSLNYVPLDKQDEYQKNNKQIKVGEEVGKGNTSSDNET